MSSSSTTFPTTTGENVSTEAFIAQKPTTLDINTSTPMTNPTTNGTKMPYPSTSLSSDDGMAAGQIIGLALGLTLGVVFITAVIMLFVIRRRRIKKKKRKGSAPALPTASEVDREIEKSKKHKKKKKSKAKKGKPFDNPAFEDESRDSSVSPDYVNIPKNLKPPDSADSKDKRSSQEMYLEPQRDDRTIYTGPEYGTEYYMENSATHSAKYTPKSAKKNNDSSVLETYEDVDQASKDSSESSDKGSQRNKRKIQNDGDSATSYENVKGIKPPPHSNAGIYQNMSKNTSGK